MNPELAASWNIIRQALAAVSANLAEHQAIQNAATKIEAALTPPAPTKKNLRNTPL